MVVWKTYWRARFAAKHVTQTAPVGATTREKVIEQQLSLLLDTLRSFMNIN